MQVVDCCWQKDWLPSIQGLWQFEHSFGFERGINFWKLRIKLHSNSTSASNRSVFQENRRHSQQEGHFFENQVHVARHHWTSWGNSSWLINYLFLYLFILYFLKEFYNLNLLFQNNWIPRHANSKPQFLRQSSLSINRSNFDAISSPVKKSTSNDESKLYRTLPRNFSYSQRQFGMTAKCPEDISWLKIPPTILNRNMKILPR